LITIFTRIVTGYLSYSSVYVLLGLPEKRKKMFASNCISVIRYLLLVLWKKK